MIDHVSIRVTDLEKSRKFYTAVLFSIGYKTVHEFEDGVGFAPEKVDEAGTFWLIKENYLTQNTHIAFRVESKDAVQTFYQAGLDNGGKDNGAPGFREEYDAGYYSAFLFDPDGNNIEAVYYEKD